MIYTGWQYDDAAYFGLTKKEYQELLFKKPEARSVRKGAAPLFRLPCMRFKHHAPSCQPLRAETREA